jgi:hypothetical protein
MRVSYRVLVPMALIGLAGGMLPACAGGEGARRGQSSREVYLWPVRIPEAAQPDRFEAIVRAALAESKAPEGTLVDIDCSFPPCIAELRGVENRPNVLDTRAWKEAFEANSMMGRRVDCGPDGLEHVLLVAAFLPGNDPPMKRMEDMLAAWRCPSGKTAQQVAGELERAPGQPIPWSDDIPAQYRPEAFEKLTREAIAQLGLKVDVLGFECSEMPCIVMLRPHPDNQDHLTSSKAWQESFGGPSASNFEGPVGVGACPAERAQLVSAHWDFAGDPKGHPAMAPAERRKLLESNPALAAKAKNLSKRLQERWQAIREKWTCAPKAP